MRFSLKDYQDCAVRQVLARLEDAKDDYRRKDRRVAFALSAITGAGKTVMASAVFEALFDGSEEFEVDGDRSAVVLWVTDDPNLNEQTRYRIMAASDRLDASRLRIIGDGFDVEKLDPGRVYFLNRQKLTAKTFITSDNKRTFTLWDTIRNTIEDPERTLYMVLDEAHRGMKEQSKASRVADETDRSSTVLRLINGHNGNPAVPIVLGISATIDRRGSLVPSACCTASSCTGAAASQPWKIIGNESVLRLVQDRPKGGGMRKLSVAIAAPALALAGAGCGSQAHQSSTTTTTTVRAATARAVSWSGPVNAPSARSIVGTWSGHLTPPPGSHASRQRFMVVIDPGERRGTWRTTSTCAGTLRLKDISYGYHHYYRVAGAHPGCAAPGIDCLKRSGAQMVDVFVPNAGGQDIDGTFRRGS